MLHDLNQAFRYATHLIAMKDGAVLAQGSVHDIVTPELIEEIFELTCLLIDEPTCGAPMVVPTPGPGALASQGQHKTSTRATSSSAAPPVPAALENAALEKESA